MKEVKLFVSWMLRYFWPYIYFPLVNVGMWQIFSYWFWPTTGKQTIKKLTHAHPSVLIVRQELVLRPSAIRSCFCLLIIGGAQQEAEITVDFLTLLFLFFIPFSLSLAVIRHSSASISPHLRPPLLRSILHHLFETQILSATCSSSP